MYESSGQQYTPLAGMPNAPDYSRGNAVQGPAQLFAPFSGSYLVIIRNLGNPTRTSAKREYMHVVLPLFNILDAAG